MAINLEDLENPEADRKGRLICVKEQATRPCLNKKAKKYVPERGGREKK